MREIVLEGNKYRGHFRGNPSRELVEHYTEYRDDTRRSYREPRYEYGFKGEAKIEDTATGKTLAVFSFETDTDTEKRAFEYTLLGDIAYAPHLRRLNSELSGSYVQDQLIIGRQIALGRSKKFIGRVCKANDISEEDLHRLVVDKTLENMVEKCTDQGGRWVHTLIIDYSLQLNYFDIPKELGLSKP